MDDEAIIAENLLAWDCDSESLAPLTDVQLESIAALAELSKQRPFPYDVRISACIIKSCILINIFPYKEGLENNYNSDSQNLWLEFYEYKKLLTISWKQQLVWKSGQRYIFYI